MVARDNTLDKKCCICGAEKYGLSRHQFNQLQESYIVYFPDKTYIIEAVHNRSKAIQRNKLSQAANDRNL